MPCCGESSQFSINCFSAVTAVTTAVPVHIIPGTSHDNMLEPADLKITDGLKLRVVIIRGPGGP